MLGYVTLHLVTLRCCFALNVRRRRRHFIGLFVCTQRVMMANLACLSNNKQTNKQTYENRQLFCAIRIRMM